jgi:hypothetical protein
MTTTTTFWTQYDYTKPIEAALSAALGIDVRASNTGGGCICLYGQLEGGLEFLVGSAVDGPLLTEDWRQAYFAENGRYDGYGVGVYDSDTGYGRAFCSDESATTGEDVLALLIRALGMIEPLTRFNDYPAWSKAFDGTIIEERYMR